MKILLAAILFVSAPLPASAQSLSTAAAGGAPWSVLLAGNYSEAQAEADYSELQRKFPELLAKRPAMIATGSMAGGGRGAFYQVRVSAGTRAEADEFCERVKAAGGSCVVLRS